MATMALTPSQAELYARPYIHIQAMRYVRIVLDGAVTRDRLILLPLNETAISFIAGELGRGERRGWMEYRERYGAETRHLDWYVD